MPKEKKSALRSLARRSEAETAPHSALHSVEGDSLQHKWWQILPMDTSIDHELRNGDKREPCIVSTPLEALERVKNTFDAKYRDPGILVDTDHNSEHESGSTRAAGWVKALEVREDGLYAQIDFTPYGLSLVGTGEYVSRSPAFTLADRGNGVYEPVELTSLALTNTPAFTTLKVASCSKVLPKSACASTKEPAMDHKLIAQKLGLPEEVTPEEVMAALDEKLNRLNDLETAEADRVEAQAKAEEEAFMEDVKDVVKPEDKEEVRAQFRANPEGTRKLFAAFRKAAPKTPPVPGKTLGADAKTPRPATATCSAKVARDRVAFVQQVAKELNCSCSQAWNVARERKPELF